MRFWLVVGSVAIVGAVLATPSAAPLQASALESFAGPSGIRTIVAKDDKATSGDKTTTTSSDKDKDKDKNCPTTPCS
jgi:hypothetical protein